MKIVIIGGSGLIGSQLSTRLNRLGHEVLSASPASGVNTITGEGLKAALQDAEVVVDVANSPSFEDNAVMEFFQTSGRNLLAEEKAAGVKHHVALSVIGSDRVPESGYLRAKMAQEKLIKESGTPYSILRSAQFFEFAGAIAQSGTVGQEVYISTGLVQPIASADVVSALSDIVLGSPLNETVEVAGPVRLGMDEFVGYFLKATNDPRRLVPDEHARYFGAELNDQSLVPEKAPRIGKLKYEDWFSAQHLKV